MDDLFDDELNRMDELERETKSEFQEAVSIEDPIASLDLIPPIVIPKGTTLQKAIGLLQEKSVGCLLVEENGKLVGILTERDILLKITGRGLNLGKERVEDYYTPSPEYLKMEDPLAFALNKMTVGGFRHIPIINDEKEPVGLVSLVDIVHHISDYFSDAVLNLPPHPQRKGFPTPEGG